MKSVILEVPVHRPIVDHLAPVFDCLAGFLWYVVNGNQEIRQFNGQFALILLRLYRERTQLEVLNVSLLDRLSFEYFTGNFLERYINPRLSSYLSGGFVQFECELPPEDVRSSFSPTRSRTRRRPNFSGNSLDVGQRYRKRRLMCDP